MVVLHVCIYMHLQILVVEVPKHVTKAEKKFGWFKIAGSKAARVQAILGHYIGDKEGV